MVYVIVTGRSLLWLLTSLIAAMFMLCALLNPTWLIGPSKLIAATGNVTSLHTPSLGVYTRCSTYRNEFTCTTLAPRGFATDSDVFPTAWKISTFFICLGIFVMSSTVLGGIVGFCVQSIFKKSIYIIFGVAQTLAAMCFITGVMLHPVAWDSSRVRALCGADVSPFYPADCSIGMGFWLVIIGTGLTFVSACLSVPADRSTSSDKVQDQIYEGHTLICIL